MMEGHHRATMPITCIHIVLSAGIQFIVAYFMSKWGWENQCEHLGDIRLSTKKVMK